MSIARRLSAEFLGTFWLVLGGCGSAIFAALFLTHDKLQTPIGIGFAGVAFAFGLTVLTGAYAFGPISGAHFNPAVTIGLWLGKRFEGRDVLWYIIVQCIGAIAAAAVLYAILSLVYLYLAYRVTRQNQAAGTTTSSQARTAGRAK